MPSYEDDQEFDRILSVLENPIRRKILKKLSGEMNYPLQLSKELNVSQQAIMKHLKVLEDSDFVMSFEERSDKGGPPRKIYSPRKRYCIRIDIGPNTYNAEYYSYREYDARRISEEKVILRNEESVAVGGKVTGEMKNEIAGEIPAFTDPTVENYRIGLEKILDQSDENKLKSLKVHISRLNREIEKLETRRRRLLAIRERAFEEANQMISNISNNYLEREILSLFVKEEISDVETLSEILDTRKANVEKILSKIQQ